MDYGLARFSKTLNVWRLCWKLILQGKKSLYSKYWDVCWRLGFKLMSKQTNFYEELTEGNMLRCFFLIFLIFKKHSSISILGCVQYKFSTMYKYCTNKLWSIIYGPHLPIHIQRVNQSKYCFLNKWTIDSRFIPWTNIF